MLSLSSWATAGGVLALLQAVLLPGLIVVRLLRIELPLSLRLAAILALSLMANYTTIFLLAWFGLYTAPAVLWSMVAECAALLFLYRDVARTALTVSLEQAQDAVIGSYEQRCAPVRAWLEDTRRGTPEGFLLRLTLVLGAATVAYLSYLLISNVGTLFNLWDPIISWNRWALEWSANGLPRDTWEYPQLIPAAWSLAYVLAGSGGEYFAKAIMPLFPLLTVLVMLGGGIRMRSPSYLLGGPMFVLLMRVLSGSAIMATEGYVDMAVTFFSFCAIATLLFIRPSTPDRQAAQFLLLGALFAIGAAMTKQAGLYIVVLYPILSALIPLREHAPLRAQWLRQFLIYALAALALLGPFYIYKEVAIHTQGDISVLPSIHNQIYGSGKSMFEVAGAGLWYLVTKTYGLAALYAVLCLFAWRDRRVRALALLVIVPYTLFWSFVLSYDSRNISLVVPLVALVAAVGVERLIERRRVAQWLMCLPALWAAGAALACMLALTPFVSHKIASAYAHDSRQIYDTELSVLLSNYFEHHPEGSIYTNFPILYFMPATKDRIWSPFGGYSTKTYDFDAYAANANNPAFTYLLSADYTPAGIRADIEAKIRSGVYEEALRSGGYLLVKRARN
ncbi:MAG TPA: hypothetical protein VG984_00515 [Candidatus Paceibacterota bacterium]|nr:hypothetical protein [Candidatus Paceibacterota bacterium]